MVQKIIYKEDDGSLSIITPLSNFPGSIQDLANKDVPTGKAYKIIDASLIPADRTFRNAWETQDTPDTISISMPKAKEITKDKLREERKPLLATQDVLFMKAQESGADTTVIVTEKNRLRDITKLADTLQP